MEQNKITQSKTQASSINKSLTQKIFTLVEILLLFCVGYLFYQNYQINNNLKSLETLIANTRVISVPTTVPSIAPSVERLFKSTENNYEVSLPLGWYGHEADQLRDSWFSYQTENLEDAEAYIITNVISNTNPMLDDLGDKLSEGSTEETTIDSMPAYLRISEDQKTVVAIVDNESKRYIFTFYTKEPEFTSVFKQILSSIKFI